MSSRKDRKPHQRVAVLGNKTPVVASVGSPNQKLSWRIGTVDEFHGAWGWAALDMPRLGYIREKLAQFETMTWGELAASRNNKLIPVANLCTQAQARLQENRLDDFDDLWELRFSGEERLWGARLGDVLHIIWWDPRHEVCPSQKKHT